MRSLFSACVLLCAGALILVSAPRSADAFCGFYVSGADASLINDATMVVMMRDGTRTVLSMQNHYQGPTEDFALVIPVPEVLEEENVRTLPEDVFSRADQMASPRLVEYWELDPCAPDQPLGIGGFGRGSGGVLQMARSAPVDNLGVTVEAQFEVGEYEIVILSAQDSTGLDTWLRLNEYQIPEGAEPYLRPYVETGMYFFVAKVNVEEVSFDDDGQAMLSPLRFHYDSEQFSLPIRLGMINADGPQDLVVHILAPSQRYEVANYDNVTIPTNINVTDEVRERFGEFYAALFDRTLEQNPGSVVTEYAWDAATCDPCPGEQLTRSDFQTLGADVIPSGSRSFVLTRLHARYTPDDLGEDLVFSAAAPIVGGREHLTEDGELEHGSQSASINNFQGRYAIRHEWEGPIECENPIRGRWGGPWDGGGEPSPMPAQNTAFAPRGGIQLAAVVETPIPELSVTPGDVPAEEPAPANPEADSEGETPAEGSGEAEDPGASTPEEEPQRGLFSCTAAPNARGGLGAAALLLGLLVTRRRR